VERIWCGPQGDYSVSLLTRKHPKYAAIRLQFLQGWKHPDEPTPTVERILQIRNTPYIYNKYTAYLARVGNEQRRFHGTSLLCSFGVELREPPCEDSRCAVCNICQDGFRLLYAGSQTKFLRFGPGLYFTATSSKSHSYNMGSARNGNHQKEWRVMFLCKVAVGKAYKTDGTHQVDGAPRGYDSVIGEPCSGGILNYDEVVVYHEEAAIPSYLIAYSV